MFLFYECFVNKLQQKFQFTQLKSKIATGYLQTVIVKIYHHSL